MVMKHGAMETWLGYHEQFENDDWVTVKDQQLNDIGFASWAFKQPDHSGDEHCISYYSKGLNHGLNDLNCNISNPYICEIHLQKKDQ